MFELFSMETLTMYVLQHTLLGTAGSVMDYMDILRWRIPWQGGPKHILESWSYEEISLFRQTGLYPALECLQRKQESLWHQKTPVDFGVSLSITAKTHGRYAGVEPPLQEQKECQLWKKSRGSGNRNFQILLLTCLHAIKWVFFLFFNLSSKPILGWKSQLSIPLNKM